MFVIIVLIMAKHGLIKYMKKQVLDFGFGILLNTILFANNNPITDDVLISSITVSNNKPTYTIAGFIKDKNNNGIKDTVISLTGGTTVFIVTVCTGEYIFSELYLGEYKIMPTKPGHIFSPFYKKLVIKNKNFGDINFVGASKTIFSDEDFYNNLTQTLENIRVEGWGEYRSAGKCLCCDNILDGDCIVIGNVERTEKLNIPQVIDGIKSQITNDDASYFGELKRRDDLRLVTQLYLKITLPLEQEISKIILWTQKKDGRSCLTNCEVAYVDQFDRINWIYKVENNRFNDFISFDFKKPVPTKCVLLKIIGGNSRVTEVDIFSKKKD